ncbi:transporter substrate-binding domain-containing protein [Limibacillus halophilus]|uniref:Polar amino acid transport system substrate-binding protein n=1 Tax=Limibacillus halophilus TaxID=1579333 RepID=A0A839SZF6_9PROT|nr:transporter substrate-binding domain-containing protein [Limibacillus halophilus]MBB3067006.1 polar amino acid transport system substrate-binding protein [Limibacillus halophilus]
MTSRREFIAGASGIAAGAGLVAAQVTPASAQTAGTKSKLDEVRERGKVIVGVTSEAPPFGFIDEKGELVGFDIDIAKLIAKSIFGDETKIELFKQGFASRWPNTQNGTIDFGIMVTTIYPDRALQVGFTRPYIDSGIVLVVRKDSPIQSIADLNKPEFTVAHLTAPVQEERGKRFYPDAKFLTFDSVSAQFNAVKLGRATACQLDAPVALYYMRDNPEFRILNEWLTDVTGNGIFLRQDDFKWWLFLDTVVAEMLGGSRYSAYKEIYVKWFGVEPRHARMSQSGR